MKVSSLRRSLLWESHIAARYLRSKKKDGFLSVITGFSFLGICLGVATLIIVMSVMGGFREELLNRIIGMKGHVLVYSSYVEGIQENVDLFEKIKQCQHVTQVCPIIEKQSIIINASQTRGTMALAMSWHALKERDMLFKGILQPFSDDLFIGDVVLIGKRMAELMGINQGDHIILMNPQGEVTPFGTVPKQKEFKVIGFFEVGMIEYDKNIVIMPLQTGQEFFDLKASITQLEIFTDNIEKNEDVVQSIQLVLPKKLRILGWKHGDSHFFQAVQVERNVMFLILTLIVFIASFNIISGLVMLVKDKTKDIAIMKTVGASRFSVMRIFIMVGSAIGVWGTILGVIIGILLTLNLNTIIDFIQKITHANLFSPEIYFLSTLPYKLNVCEVVSIASIALVLSILATLYPSFRAARLDPAVAIRES